MIKRIGILSFGLLGLLAVSSLIVVAEEESVVRINGEKFNYQTTALFRYEDGAIVDRSYENETLYTDATNANFMISGIYLNKESGEKRYTVLQLNEKYFDRGILVGFQDALDCTDWEIGDLMFLSDVMVLESNPPKFKRTQNTTIEKIGNAREVFGEEIMPVLKHELRLSLFHGIGKYNYHQYILLPVAADIMVAGDVYQDGELDILDVVVVNKNLIGVTELNQEQVMSGDVNWDGSLDSVDSLMILREVVGLTESFEESDVRAG